MHVLVVAATQAEIPKLEIRTGSLESDILVTGVGMTSTAYSLTKILCSKKYDLAINIGVAGSFREELKTGDVAHVVTDSFADLGIQDGEDFLSVFESGLQKQDMFPFWNGKLKPDLKYKKLKTLEALKKVSAITVNTVHGNDESIQKIIQRFHPDIESMEGAAFFYCCIMEKIPCIQLRAISNRVERRNKEAWNIPLALQNLHEVTNSLIFELSAKSSNLL
jgi:futalosine hydrolase